MLSSQNTGKYLSGMWHEDRCLAIQEIDNFTSAQLSFLEMDGTQEGPNGKRAQFGRTMCMKTIPVDEHGEECEYDYRCTPEVGK